MRAHLIVNPGSLQREVSQINVKENSNMYTWPLFMQVESSRPSFHRPAEFRIPEASTVSIISISTALEKATNQDIRQVHA